MSIRHTVRFSNHPAARAARALYRWPETFSLPLPGVVVRPLRALYECIRSVTFFLRRVLIAEPAFKSYCHTYGKRLHTGVWIHWIQGKGEIVLGDDVLFDGKSSFKFAACYTDRPRLQVGNKSGIGHQCTFHIGKSITIGNDCHIAAGVLMFDTPGHPLAADARRNGDPAPDEDVKPIVIGDNVWIGARSTVFPGVIIGDNSVIAMASAVMTNVPANTLVGGNPARSVRNLAKD